MSVRCTKCTHLHGRHVHCHGPTVHEVHCRRLGGADDDECERSEHEEEEVPREVRRIAGNSGVGNHFAPVSRLKYAHQA